MGQDKALLEKEGVSLLRCTWDIARTVTSDVWVVTSRLACYRTLLPKTAQWFVEPLPEPEQEPAGPLMAFTRSLEHVEAEWVLLLACDLPNLQSDVLQSWSRELSSLPGDAIAYLPQSNHGWEPLCGFYRSSCLASLKNYQASGARSFQKWLNQQSVISILSVPAGMLKNCNTPEDWATVVDDTRATHLREFQNNS